jgi:hypothetical protein
MEHDDPRDVCAAQYMQYIARREEHTSVNMDPEGREHEIDVCRLLCMSEMTAFGLGCARMDEHDVVAARACEQGALLTFYPGDVAVYAPPGASAHICMRLCSDRVRRRLGNEVEIAGMVDVGDGYSIYGHASFDDNTDYLGHLVATTGAETNCEMQTMGGLAVAVVATRAIQAGERLVRREEAM